MKKNKPSTTKKSRAKASLSVIGKICSWVGVFFSNLIKTVIWTCRTPLALLSVAIVVVITFLILSDIPFKTLRMVETQLAELAVKTDVQFEYVYLEGQRYTKTEDILAQMDVKIGMPLFAIDLKAIRSRLEALPWVRYAEVERQYPSTLTIRIVERKPVALWQRDQKLRLLDNKGEVIAIDDIGQFSDYLIIVGENVPFYLGDVAELLESQPALKPLVSSVVRVSDRRWDIVLRNNIRVMLPEFEPKKMWAYLAQLHYEKDILADYDIESINLKVSDKIFIERASEKKNNVRVNKGNT